MRKWNTQTKTSILFLSAFLVVITVFSLFVYISIANYLIADFYKLLGIRAKAVAQMHMEPTGSENWVQYQNIKDEFVEKLYHEKDYVFKMDTDSSLFKAADSLGLPPVFLNNLIRNGDAEYSKGHLLYKGIVYAVGQQEYAVVTSAENAFESRLTSYLVRTLLLAIVISLLFSLIFSIYTSRSIFKPISLITEKVQQISSENLHLRLDQQHYNGEFFILAGTFNDMLNRIETAFETQNNFISNASHELRTPLTGIIGTADVCLSKVRTTDEYIETMTIILAEAEKLDSKTKALLFLAQTGFDGKIQKFERIRIDQLLWDVKETIERLDKKNKVTIDTSLLPENASKLKVTGNEQLLHLALTNIINNACKYSNYQVVHISIGASDDKVVIIVKDIGIGIPEKELKYIYDPFFRASNTKKYEGYGIGLPLTNNIIKMHNGKITVHSREQEGTTVQIDLPAKGSL